jgi:hypothetical protein
VGRVILCRSSNEVLAYSEFNQSIKDVVKLACITSYDNKFFVKSCSEHFDDKLWLVVRSLKASNTEKVNRLLTLGTLSKAR